MLSYKLAVAERVMVVRKLRWKGGGGHDELDKQIKDGIRYRYKLFPSSQFC